MTPNFILSMCVSADDRRIFRDVINIHHSYMDYKDTCNRRINWLVYETASGNLVGAVGVNSAIMAMRCRDNYIGWDKDKRLRNLNKIANNYRFGLIAENFTTPNGGTQILSTLRRVAQVEWLNRYGDVLVLLETLVKPPWTGAVYKADNWEFLGMTLGTSFSKAPLLSWQKESGKRGELARSDPEEAIRRYAVGGVRYKITESEPKLIFVKPLLRNWRKYLE